jgi:hypothetical protein
VVAEKKCSLLSTSADRYIAAYCRNPVYIDFAVWEMFRAL